MTETILTYIAMWAPSLIGVLGIVSSIIFAINKVKDTIAEFKASNLAKENSELITINKELVKANKLLIDKITKIEGYSDEVLK